MSPTSVRLTPELAARLDAWCADRRRRTGRNVSRAEAIRVACEELVSASREAEGRDPLPPSGEP